jgi:L-alanine-DL-glutamate epimerase-like enolase superfamily enzyme
LKITNVSADVVRLGERSAESLSGTGRSRGRTPRIVPVGRQRRERYTPEWVETDRPVFEAHELFLRVQTDDGVEGVCTGFGVDLTPKIVEILRMTVVGLDPLKREEIYQRLHLGTRWVYQTPGWFGHFDNCLWDIAGKVAGMPVARLVGQVRDRVAAYHTGDDGDGTAEHYLRMIADVRERFGITAYKFHNYEGAAANIKLFRRLRRELGDEYTLINDPVCSYTLREAIEVGRVMEELGFLWLEEPFREQEMRQYQELCKALTIPVMATEMLMNDINICAQWLLAGATDLVRVSAARSGTTGLLKLAHFAELFGTSVEINGPGGLGGHVHVQLGCAVANTELFEHFERFAPLAREYGIVNAPMAADGHLTPSALPGWGAEIDWEFVKRHTVEVY